MAQGKKLSEMTSDELVSLVLHLSELLKRSKRDLPPNEEANRRHQRHKRIWGEKKKQLLALLNRCLPLVDDELADDIEEALNHEEMHWHKTRVTARRKKNNARNRRKLRRG